jgi:ubiquinone/menaquinone biosynthesis C-methylase UbiE
MWWSTVKFDRFSPIFYFFQDFFIKNPQNIQGTSKQEFRSALIFGVSINTGDYQMPHSQAALLPVEEDSEFVHFWNEVLAPKFFRFKHVLVDGLSQHSEAVFPTLPVKSADRVLDVGCGFGDTALKLAEIVGRDGTVVGVDCCDSFLDYARNEAKTADVRNLSFIRGDAEISLPSGDFDVVFARFGTMFFANPVAGLRNMRKSLRPGGKMVHIVWRNRADNPWLSMAKDIVLQFLPQPGDAAQTCGPGPFSMANEDMVRMMMESAGYTDIRFQRVDALVSVGDDVKDAIAFQLAIGPAGEVFREAGELAEQKRPEIEAAMAEAINKQKLGNNGIVMDSSSWVISATNPE